MESPESGLPPSPTSSYPSTDDVSPLQLINALSACILSTKLSSQHKQWAAKHLLQSLSTFFSFRMQKHLPKSTHKNPQMLDSRTSHSKVGNTL
jgi:hypothetical protein